MPQFYFHLATPSGHERDEIGNDFPSAEVAYLEARQAAMEISAEAILRGRSPADYRFEVMDRDQRLIFDLAFSEMLLAKERPAAGCNDVLRTRVAENVKRSRELQGELSAGFAEARAALATTFALLRGRS